MGVCTGDRPSDTHTNIFFFRANHLNNLLENMNELGMVNCEFLARSCGWAHVPMYVKFSIHFSVFPLVCAVDSSGIP